MKTYTKEELKGTYDEATEKCFGNSTYSEWNSDIARRAYNDGYLDVFVERWGPCFGLDLYESPNLNSEIVYKLLRAVIKNHVAA